MIFFNSSRNQIPSMIIHGQFLEIVWTVVPSLILLVLAIPSFALIYSMDEVVHPAVTLKVTGNQWYWNYEYSDYEVQDEDSESADFSDNGKTPFEEKYESQPLAETSSESEEVEGEGEEVEGEEVEEVEMADHKFSDLNNINFDSYMIPEEDLEEGQLRLLEVDNRVVLPVNTHVRLLITGRDVIHNWAIPSLGVKCDGLPGRLNQASLFIKREGVFYGQCSELCGVHHGFMPIVVEAVSLSDYLDWIQAKLAD